MLLCSVPFSCSGLCTAGGALLLLRPSALGLAASALGRQGEQCACRNDSGEPPLPSSQGGARLQQGVRTTVARTKGCLCGMPALRATRHEVLRVDTPLYSDFVSVNVSVTVTELLVFYRCSAGVNPLVFYCCDSVRGVLLFFGRSVGAGRVQHARIPCPRPRAAPSGRRPSSPSTLLVSPRSRAPTPTCPHTWPHPWASCPAWCCCLAYCSYWGANASVLWY